MTVISARKHLEQLEALGIRVRLKLVYEKLGESSPDALKVLSESKFGLIEELLEANAPITIGGGNAQAEIATLGPAEAAEMLEANVRNRPLGMKHVERYTRLMKQGKWLLSCDAVGFDTDGALINGQHRLEAIVKSETSQPVLIVRGLDPKVFEVADAGKPRSAADILASHGFSNYNLLAALAKVMLSYKAQGRAHLNLGKYRLENSNVLELCQAYPGLSRSAAFAQNLTQRSRLNAFVEGRLIAFAHAVYGVKHPDIERWLESLVTGANLSADDALFVLRNKFLADLQARAKLPFEEKLALLIVALNRKAKQVSTTSLRWSGEDDKFPQPLGVIASEAFESLRS